MNGNRRTNFRTSVTSPQPCDPSARVLHQAMVVSAASITTLWLLTAPGAVGAELAVDRDASASFSLLDHAGRPVTERDFRGRFMLVFFGYTSCPDVCPVDLHLIGQAMSTLGEAGQRVQPLFITLDPERDTPEAMARYAGYFHPRLLGLTGTPEQVARAAQEFGVIYVKAMKAQDGAGSGSARYSIDHSAYTYLLGPDGRFLAAFDHGTDAKTLAAGIARHLKHPSP